MNLGQYITKYCEEQDISVKKFSTLSGINRSYIYMFRNGSRAPGMDTYVKAAKAMGMGIEDLLAETDFKIPVAKRIKGTSSVLIPIYTSMPLDIENVDGSTPISTNKASAFIGFRVSDNDMAPTIYPNDILIVQIMSSIPNGSVILAQYKEQTIIRQYMKDRNTTILKAYNPEIPDLKLNMDKARSDLLIFGCVIEMRRKL